MNDLVGVEAFIDRLRDLAARPAGAQLAESSREARRLLVGVCGPPGSGKSTLTAQLASALDAVVVPMDGFHLPNSVLDARALRAVKGAPHTFDAAGFVEAVRSLREGATDVDLPSFDRDIDEPVPGAIHVPASASIVLIEGNYLLLDESPWSDLRQLLDVTAFIDVDDDLRVERLVARHVQFGRTPAEAREFVLRSDERNAALVLATRQAADVVVAVD